MTPPGPCRAAGGRRRRDALRVSGAMEVLLEAGGVAPRAEADWVEGAPRVEDVLTWP